MISKGYELIHLTSVQTLKLDKVYTSSVNSPMITVKAWHSVEDEWFDYYCILSHFAKEHKATYKKMLSNLIVPNFCMSLFLNNEVIACGLGVLEHGFIGLFDIVVHEEYRNNGYGEQLLMSMLESGQKQGAENAYLQVMLDNKPALRLYEKIGFKHIYDYWYRVLL